MHFEKRVQWIRVYLTEEAAQRKIPLNSSQTVTAGGWSFCMARTEEGIFALGPRCPHQGFKWGGASCQDGIIVCPLHRFGFNLKNGKGQGMHVETFPVEVRKDGVFVGVERRVFVW